MVAIETQCAIIHKAHTVVHTIQDFWETEKTAALVSNVNKV